MEELLSLAATAVCISAAIVVAFLAVVSVWLRRRKVRNASGLPTLAFFHPYCDDGGGGERVLWCGIQAIQEAGLAEVVVYSGGTERDGAAIVARAQQRFQIRLARPVRFVFLGGRGWVEAARYPAFTMLGQSAGSVVLGVEALLRLTPDAVVDSMGYAFVLPLFRVLGGCRTGAYVHYPTISTDMLAAAAGASLRSRVKVAYYRAFAVLYGIAGRFSQQTMVNSSWTRAHIAALWGGRPRVVFPPCPTQRLRQLPDGPRQPWVLSIAQFRPEKNHRLQLQAFAQLVHHGPATATATAAAADLAAVRLVLAGSARHHDDRQRVADLRAYARELRIDDRVDFCIDLPFDQLLELYGKATAGIHTMWNEHFGIGVVELMAAGVLTVAHNSGGPRSDIVTAGAGFLATTADDYARHLAAILALPPSDAAAVRAAARASTDRFSDAAFQHDWLEACRALLHTKRK